MENRYSENNCIKKDTSADLQQLTAQLNSMQFQINEMRAKINLLNSALKNQSADRITVKAASYDHELTSGSQDVKTDVSTSDSQDVKTDVSTSASQDVKTDVSTSGSQDVKNAALTTSQKGNFKNSIENRLGRNIMGIMASVLIFISIVLFSISDIPGQIKLTGIYIISLLMFLTGYYLMRKTRDAFSVSLTGCGAGAIFISIYLTYFYYGYINLPAVLILLLAWSFFLAFFSTKTTWHFKIIGQLGIALTCVFSFINLCTERTDSASLFTSQACFILSFFYIASLFYMFVFDDRIMPHEITQMIIAFISFSAMYFSFRMSLAYVERSYNISVSDTNICIFCILFLAYLLYLHVMFAKKLQFDRKLPAAIYLIFVFATTIFIATDITGFLFCKTGIKSENISVGRTALVIFFICMLLIEIFRNKRVISKCNGSKSPVPSFTAYICVTTFLSALIWMFLPSADIKSDALVCRGVFIILMAVAALITKMPHYKYISYCFTAWYVLFFYTYSVPDKMLYPCMVIFPIAALLILFINMLPKIKLAETKSSTDICAIYTLFLLWLLNVLSFENYNILDETFGNIYAYYAIAIVSCIMCYAVSIYNSYFKKGSVYINIIHGIVMFAGLCYLGCDSMPVWLKILTQLMVTIVFCVNTGKWIKKYNKNNLVMYFIVFKFTSYTWVSLYSYEANPYLISGALLLIATSSILLGFCIKIPGFRQFGLVLALFGAIKLVIADSTYNNKLIQAVSFLLCGILCFIISLVYSKLSKYFED
jgi:hypothetical protein